MLDRGWRKGCLLGATLAALQAASLNAHAFDLCDAMRAAGARDFGRGLQIFPALRDAGAAGAGVRTFRCNFRSFDLTRSEYQDLTAGLSPIRVPAEAFAAQLEAARAVSGRQAWMEYAVGAAGFGWMHRTRREAEVHFLLDSGRQLKVRWSGEGTEPVRDLSALRAFAARLAALIE